MLQFFSSVISTGEVYNFHFIKGETVVSFLDKEQKLYSLPLYSSAMVAPLYNPDGDIKKALKGYSFKTIGDLLACSDLPKIVGVRKSYIGHQPISSVNANEVLIITKTVSATMNLMRSIKAFSLSTSRLFIL